MVTALCALLVGLYPELRPFEIKALLKHFAAATAASAAAAPADAQPAAATAPTTDAAQPA